MSRVPDSDFDPPEYPECPGCGEYVYAINDYKCEECAQEFEDFGSLVDFDDPRDKEET